eukprot:scaffold1878_cov170-Amphora_coffeaeformis.AAC.10
MELFNRMEQDYDLCVCVCVCVCVPGVGSFSSLPKNVAERCEDIAALRRRTYHSGAGFPTQNPTLIRSLSLQPLPPSSADLPNYVRYCTQPDPDMMFDSWKGGPANKPTGSRAMFVVDKRVQDSLFHYCRCTRHIHYHP